MAFETECSGCSVAFETECFDCSVASESECFDCSVASETECSVGFEMGCAVLVTLPYDLNDLRALQVTLCSSKAVMSKS
jgi:hypothetical protein